MKRAPQRLKFMQVVLSSLLVLGVGGASADEAAKTSRQCVISPKFDPPFSRQDPPVVKFFADMTFTGGPEQPPQIEVVYTNAPRDLKAYFIDYVQGFRLPCRPVGEESFKTDWSFIGSKFDARGKAVRIQLKEKQVTLPRFLDLMKEVPGERVSFDLDMMACPFKVNWTTLRPAAPNRARADGAANVNRGEFLQWLASLELDVSDRERDQLIGESMEVKIPCGRINLGPPAPPSTSASSPNPT